MKYITSRKEKINLLNDLLQGRKSIAELKKEKFFIVREKTPDQFTDEQGQVWTLKDIDQHRSKNPTHYFFCLSTILQEEKWYWTNENIYSKTGIIPWR